MSVFDKKNWLPIINSIVFLLLLSVGALMAQSKGAVTGKVTDNKTGEPLPGANIVVVGTQIGTTSGADGSYKIKLPVGKYELNVTFIGYKHNRTSVSVNAGATSTQNFALNGDLLLTDAVVVLGSRSGRTVVESPVPIDVLTEEEIRTTGLTQTTQILQQLVPSYNAPQPSITDGSDHMRPATLRGLGPDQVLILVNGKRRHTSALVHVNGSIGRGATGVDLNALPAGSIEKIEVLRDGAAAQYGSDAIAGVINIVLKEKLGFDANVSYSQNFSSVTRGFAEDERNKSDNSDAGAYSWDGDGIGGQQDVNYRDGETTNLHLGYGMKLGAEGNIYFSGQLRNRNRAVRAGLDPRQQYFDGDSRESSFNRLNHVYGQGEFDDISLFFNSSMPIGEEGGKFYAFGGYNDREGSTGCYYRRALDNRTVRALHPDGFLPTLDNRLKDFSLAGGFKGQIGAWSYDLSETFGSNSFNFIVGNTNNASQGTSSKTKFDAGTLKFKQATTNLDLLRAVDIGTASPLNLAVGAEFRLDNYQIDPGEADSYANGNVPVLDGPNAGSAAPVGSSCFPGFSDKNATDESRTNFGAYLYLENKLTNKFLMGVAARFENYSDFGSTVTGKATGRFELTEEFAIRGAFSTGFRAPSLAQSWYSAIATNFIDGVPYEVGTFPVSHPVARAFGAKDLEAEKSVNFSGGLTYAKDNVSITVDAYQIDIKDRIVFTENFTGSGVASYLQTQNIDANGGRFFTNAVNTSTKGLDIIARYATEMGDGTLRLTAAMNFNNTDITNKSDIVTPAVLANYTSKPLFGRTEQGRFEVGQPGQKINLSANYDIRKYAIMLRTSRYGEVTSLNSADPDPATGVNLRDVTYSAKWLTDLELKYKISKGMALAIGANNLFDVYPDKQLKVNSFNGIFPYSGLSPFGFFGRSLYSRLTINL